tara:strand:- start:7356 stop:7916 length:561 start_codon:yes stop_codon:yes gene_type:complete
MRGRIAISISILIFASSVVSAAGGGGENQVTDLQDTGISEVTFSNVFYGNQDFLISVQLEENSNISSIEISTQICVNSGLCYPPESQNLVKDNSTEIWSVSVSPMNGQTYVNWNFVLNEGENDTRIPETGWGWKVWSDCWFDGENWGGENENGGTCGQIVAENTPATGVIAAAMSVFIAAIVIRHR